RRRCQRPGGLGGAPAPALHSRPAGGSALMAQSNRTPPPGAMPPDLSAVLLAAEMSGQLRADAWPALRALLLTLAEAQELGDGELLASELEAAVGPLRELLTARQALTQARAALDAGYAALARAGDDPALIAE